MSGVLNFPTEKGEDWENYVERVIAFLSKAPYHVEYFQIWNEADDRFTGFWIGGMDQYMKTIHLPAARIIRKYGGKVVYGGYPISGSIEHLIDVIERHKAWDTVDVLAIHYYPLADWNKLYEKVLKPGKVWGLWATEMGWTTSTGWVPNNYPRFFHWALRHQWQPDRYRIFHFNYDAPDDPNSQGYKRTLVLGNKLSHHGKALVTLGELLDSPRIAPFTNWQTDPPLATQMNEALAGVEGFDTGTQIVLAVHLAQNAATTITINISGLGPDEVKSAHRVGIYGSRQPLQIERPEKDIRLKVPVEDDAPIEHADNRLAPVATFYVALEK